MKKIIAILGMLCLLPLTAVMATTAPAFAACGGEEHITSYISTGSDNLLIAGRPVRATLHVTKRDCDGYDLVTGMYGTVTKNTGGCTSLSGTGWTTDGYRLNPNVIGDYNGGDLFINCVGGTTSYIVFWNAYEKLTASMPAAARCVGMHFKVVLVAHTDSDFDTDSICFNGK